MKLLRKIPLFGLLLAIYDLLALTGPADLLGRRLASLRLASGVLWTVTIGELLVVVGLLALFLEVFKATRTAHAIADHILSTLVFIVFLVEFIVLARAATSVFFLLTLMSLFDVVAGFTISITTARRDITLDRDASFIQPAA